MPAKAKGPGGYDTAAKEKFEEEGGKLVEQLESECERIKVSCLEGELGVCRS